MLIEMEHRDALTAPVKISPVKISPIKPLPIKPSS